MTPPISPTASAEPWRPRRSARLSEDVANDVLARIVRGEFASGALLQSEAVLCEYYDVSRPVLREAIKSVEQLGLVRVRQGEGTTVLPKIEWNLLNSRIINVLLEVDDGNTLRSDIARLRGELEANMTRRCVPRLTPQDFDELQLYVDELTAATNADEFKAMNRDFHYVIYRASGDDISRAIVSQLQVVSDGLVPFRYTPERITEAHDAHGRILARLRKGDADGAATAMAEHMSAAWLF